MTFGSRLGLVMLAVILLIGTIGPALVAVDPTVQDLAESLQPPSSEHLLGTDALGRSVLSRLVYGAHYSLGASLICVCLAVVLGFGLGLAAGYSGGWLDDLIMRLVDGMMAFPGTLLAIVIAGLLGGGRAPLIWALVLTGWCDYCRLSRNMTRTILAEPYVQAGRLLGFSPAFIMRRYLAGQILPQMSALASLNMGRTILNLSALGFLGIGLEPPAPEWGAMIADSLSLMGEASYLIIFPGTAIFVTVLGFQLVSTLFDRGAA